MLLRVRAPIAALLLVAAHAGCTSIVCGENTEPKFDPSTGTTTCTGKIPTKYVQCDPNSTKVEGGICVGDPDKFPHCGAGTMIDPSMACVPMQGSCGHTPPSCVAKPGKFAINGLITHLKDGKFTDGEMVEVRVYDPLAFLKNTATPPQATLTTMNSGYCFDSLVDTGGQGLIAIAVTDPGGTNWTLGGVGQNNVTPGNLYRVDAYVIEKTLVAQWDTSAGLAGMNTFEAVGGYVVRFFDKPRLMGGAEDPTEKPVAGVQLVAGFVGTATDAYYFKGDLLTIDKTATATDGVTGTVVQRTSGLTPVFSGKGGMVNGMAPTWERFPGGSTAGVVFVQTLHPAAM
jgi:hypothetical protein